MYSFPSEIIITKIKGSIIYSIVFGLICSYRFIERQKTEQTTSSAIFTHAVVEKFISEIEMCIFVIMMLIR